MFPKWNVDIGDLTFLYYYPGGDATLIVPEPSGRITSINELNLEYIESASPILAFSFEDTTKGPKHSMENVSLTAVACLLRYIYCSQHYVPDSCEDQTHSLLVHVEVYRLAVAYDMAALKDMAKGRIFFELELSVSNPEPPEDLCEALAYAYKHLPNEKHLTETLAQYCVTCYMTQKLNEDKLFKTFHYECRQFQRDLSTVLRNNRFEDESAPILIQLPIKTPPTRFPLMHDADPLGGLADEDWEERLQRRRAEITRLDKLRIHFRISLPYR